MRITDQLKAEVDTFLENMDRKMPERNREVLMLLIDKYVQLFSTPISLNKNDFDMIREQALAFYTRSKFPRYLGAQKSEITFTDANIISIIEGTIGVLNGKECFKKLPKFDYRD